MALSCGFLVFDGFSNMVLASAIEPLRAARDYAGAKSFAWRLLSPTGDDTVSSSGIHLRCDGSLNDVQGLDVLFLVAGYGARDHARSAAVKRLQRAAREVPAVGALDSGAWVLAAAGLLDGFRAAIHWQDAAAFAEDHPAIDVRKERFIVDRNRITAGSAAAVVDLMLDLIARHGGGALAFDVSNLFVYDTRTQTGDQPGTRSPLAARAPQLVRAVAAMRDNIEERADLAAIAAAAAVSPRTLARLFEHEFGVSPGRYYQNICLDVARVLAEETRLGAKDIAARTGFASAATLSRAFTRHYGANLRDARGNRRGVSRT